MLINFHRWTIANSSLQFNCSLKHFKPKVNIFDGKKKNAISASGLQDK